MANVVCLEQLACGSLMCLLHFPILIRLGLFGEPFYGAVITSLASGGEKKKKEVISHTGQCVMNPASVCSDVPMEI